MKRSATDVLRRGLDMAVANWPLIGVRMAEAIVVFTMMVISLFAAVVPLLVSAGMSHFDPRNTQGAAEAIIGLLTDHWMVLVYLFLLMIVVLLLALVVHSFVEAGVTQVLVDAERRAAPVTNPDRGVFAAFSGDRWFAGAKHSWWAVFWVYNIVWSAGLAFVLVPLIITLAGMLMVPSPGGRVAVACGGIALSVLVLIPVSIICGIWTAKTIAVCVARNLPARESCSRAWRELKADFSRHLIVGLIIYAISFGAAIVLSTMSSVVSMTSNRHAPMFGLAFAPLQIVSSLAQSVVSAAIGIWLLACFVSMTEER